MSTHHKVFAYGLLKYPELVDGLIGRHLQTQPAVLHGFRRMNLGPSLEDGCAMIVPSPDHLVDGLLITDLTDEELRIFDLFEYVPQGVYARSSLSVVSNGEQVGCFAYTMGLKANPDLLNGDWQESEYLEATYKEFLEQTIPAFRLEVEQGSGLAPWSEWAETLTTPTKK